MLALMCVVYRGRGYIPRNRPEVYDKCATMLFETWDKHREIESVSPIEEHLRPALRELAHWIYSTPDLAAGAPELLLLERTTQFLDTWLFEDRNRAEHAARGFLDFCRGRAWVFTETGYDASGQPLFGFVHRTFLEFFTAEQVVGMHETPESLAKTLIPRLARSEWDVVGQLAFQIQSKRHLGHADRLLSSVLVTAQERKRAGERRNLLSFAARLLEILVPKPSTTARVADSVLTSLVVDSAVSAVQRESLLKDLMRSGPEANSAVMDTSRKVVFEWLQAGESRRRRLGAELLLRGALLTEDEALPSGDAWRGALAAWLAEARDEIVGFARSDADLAIDCWDRGWMTATKAIEHHGPSWAIHRREELLFAVLPFETPIVRVAGDTPERGRDLANGLAHARAPWFYYDLYGSVVKRQGLARHLIRTIPTGRDRDHMDLWLVAAAAACELDADAASGRTRGPRLRPGDVWNAVLDAPDEPPILVIAARGGYVNERDAERALLDCRVSTPVAAVLRSWMHSETDFIEVD